MKNTFDVKKIFLIILTICLLLYTIIVTFPIFFKKHLVLNNSPSQKMGLFWVSNKEPEVGDYCILKNPRPDLTPYADPNEGLLKRIERKDENGYFVVGYTNEELRKVLGIESEHLRSFDSYTFGYVKEVKKVIPIPSFLYGYKNTLTEKQKEELKEQIEEIYRAKQAEKKLQEAKE